MFFPVNLAGSLLITNDTNIQLAILSTKLLVILGINATAKIDCPDLTNQVNNTSLKSPVIPPYTRVAIGVPIRGATTDKIKPVIIDIIPSYKDADQWLF